MAVQRWPGGAKASVQTISGDDARSIAKDAYIYGFPIVDSYRILYSYFVDRSSTEYKADWNEKVYNNARVFTPNDMAMQTPNSDTPYSQLGLDLRAEPMVLTMPAVEKGRYYTAEVNDLYTFFSGYIGTRTTGNDAGDFLIVGPDWQGEKPQGIKAVIRSETQLSFIFYRMTTNGRKGEFACDLHLWGSRRPKQSQSRANSSPASGRPTLARHLSRAERAGTAVPGA